LKLLNCLPLLVNQTVSDLIKILLVDDDEEDYLITRDTLADIQAGQKYQLAWVSDYAEAIETIARKKHDVYLIDYKLGSFNGLDIISRMRNENFRAPFILLTGLNDWEVAEKALKLGASDYLVKGTFSAEELNRILRYNLRDAKYIEEIHSLNSDLESRVRQRTSELARVINELASTNNNLQQLLDERERTQLELKKSLEKEKDLGLLKARFVTMASHEFRTPLSTILSSTCLIEKYNETPEVEKRRKHLDRIKLNIKNLTDILNDFLSLGKLEDSNVKIDLVPFVFKELAEEAVKDMELLLKKGQSIRYKETGDENNGHLVSDKKILKNILINLLSNAVKYSNEEKEILLDASHKPGQLIIQVKDSGIGIPEKDQEHLFERFFRAENAVNIQGTGLGLNIVKKYIELMKGDITFESKVNEGTTFTVTLPL